MVNNLLINNGLASIIKSQPNYPNPILIRVIPFYVEQKFGKKWEDLASENGLGKITLTKYLEMVESENGFFKVHKKGPGLHEVELGESGSNTKSDTPDKNVNQTQTQLSNQTQTQTQTHNQTKTQDINRDIPKSTISTTDTQSTQNISSTLGNDRKIEQNTSKEAITSIPNVRPSSFRSGSSTSSNSTNSATNNSNLSRNTTTNVLSQQKSSNNELISKSVAQDQNQSQTSQSKPPPSIPSRTARQTDSQVTTSNVSKTSEIQSQNSQSLSDRSLENSISTPTKSLIKENETLFTKKANLSNQNHISLFDSSSDDESFTLSKRDELQSKVDSLTRYIEQQKAFETTSLFESPTQKQVDRSNNPVDYIEEVDQEDTQEDTQEEIQDIDNQEIINQENSEEDENLDQDSEVSKNSFAPPIRIELTFIYQWLKKINLEKYAQNFVDYGVEDESTLLGLDKSDLNKMRIKNLDDRNEITNILELEKKRQSLSGLDFDF